MIMKTVEVLRTEFIKITVGGRCGVTLNPTYHFDLKMKLVDTRTNTTKL